tara:strand:- start:55 stop:486 length:432 start_codon:yes stop_codon:yes gene_type:complete
VRDDRRNHCQSSPPRDGRKRGTQSQAIGKSKGGWTTKILALADGLGNVVRFVLMPANRYHTVGVAPLIRGIRFDALLADKAFDSNWIIDDMNERGAKIVVSQRPQRRESLKIDAEMLQRRHLVEMPPPKTERVQTHSDAAGQS